MANVNYGIDAPDVIRNLALVGLACAALAVAAPYLPLGAAGINSVRSIGTWAGCGFGIQALLMLWTSLVGKRVAARQLIAHAALRGDEHVLDVGCGRGLLLLHAAQQLPRGAAVGLDLWSGVDLSGNARAATEANAAALGLTARVQVHDGDMRQMPFDDASFDCVVSSLAIHNIEQADGRAKAMHEIVRVLRPGGRVLLQDFRHCDEYAGALTAAGLQDVRRTLINPLLMFPPTWRVSARKPSN